MTDTMTLSRDTSTHVMPEQPELDLPSTLAAPVIPSATWPARGKAARKGLPPSAIAAMVLAVAVLLWGAWVTKTLMTPPAAVPMASVRLEQLVGEYVQSQARSAAPPELVTQQTQAFMSALGEELKRRGQDGTTVLVGEAVLSQNVPDITDQVRAAIYAKVPPPSVAGGPAVVPPLTGPLGQ
ncbi:TrbI F-type domain-containing protein [Croceicoccus marinus]|uniref:TrbI F-type domain-containing protein n=1 Tax=Croceicoccus marinus TaxID=450378 RepID=A0A7G6W1A7_9SPHN|nr:TrbI F-type domain-containing protein [Croceicoccus marinus]QNE07772.1 TrbI F-type domain-containing protein [Croceicoccus marinus]